MMLPDILEGDSMIEMKFQKLGMNSINLVSILLDSVCNDHSYPPDTPSPNVIENDPMLLNRAI